MDSSGCAYLVDKDMRYMVYKWGFPYLDYSLEVSISWIYLLSLYNWFCHFCTSYYLMPHSCLGVCVHDTVFNACFWFRFIDTRINNSLSSSNCMKLPYGSHACSSRYKNDTSIPDKSQTKRAPASLEVLTPPHTGNILHMEEIPKAE